LLISHQLCHLAFELRIFIAAAGFALDVSAHLLEAHFDPLLQWLHRLRMLQENVTI
jgi:hypothetical protein